MQNSAPPPGGPPTLTGFNDYLQIFTGEDVMTDDGIQHLAGGTQVGSEIAAYEIAVDGVSVIHGVRVGKRTKAYEGGVILIADRPAMTRYRAFQNGAPTVIIPWGTIDGKGPAE